jgi:hypothetical protein
MTKSQEATRHAKSEASAAKRRLMDLLSTLDATPGCSTEARRLSAIIARLEAWQNT